MASFGPGGGDRRSWRGQRSEAFGNRAPRRGTGAQRSHGGWRGNARGGRTEPEAERLEKRPMGRPIGTIGLSEVQSAVQLKDAAPTIEDCQYVASYNWLNREKPTILVPGKCTDHDSRVLPIDNMKAHRRYGLRRMCLPVCSKTAEVTSEIQMLLAGQDFPWSQP